MVILRWLLHHCARLWFFLRRCLWLGSRRHGRYRHGSQSIHRFRAHPKPTWVRAEVVRLKALMPEAGCRLIAHHFNRRFAVRRRMTVGKTYVASTLRRHPYLILKARRKLKHRVPHPLPRNLIWGMDLLVARDHSGRQHLAIAIVDHASRACLRLQRLPDKSSVGLMQHIAQTVRRYGRPRFVRTDNEAVFCSRYLRWGLQLLGIGHQRSDPGCPWPNGRVERFIGTVKQLLAANMIRDSTHLERTLQDVRTHYNRFRPHQHLDGRTPAEAWAGVDVFAPRRQVHTWRMECPHGG
jgi:putative transposase